LWNKGLKMQGSSPHPHACKTLYDAQPGTRHAGDMATIGGVFVVIIKIQSCRPQIEFVSFLFIPYSGSQNAMNAGRK